MLSLTALAVASCSIQLPSGAQVPIPAVPGGVPHRVAPQVVRPHFKVPGSGTLHAITKSGKHLNCPLQHTSVEARVSGNTSRVTVHQLFMNNSAERLEAIYTFPLSDSAAVDDMLMKVGDRTIHGTIKKKEEAREIYENAKANGNVASLLDQERPNIFTQSVANLEPHKQVEVTITYVDQLPYEAGTYTFAFPTVVGPRFTPGGGPEGASVPDAGKIHPNYAAAGTRAGHDISISLAIDEPVPVLGVHSQLHEILTRKRDDRHLDISLVDKETIPNRDFVVSWDVASDKVRSGCLTNGKDGQGYFNITVFPPKRPQANQIQPKEMVYLIDCSGSQSGQPLEKCKQVMRYALDHMNANDTFQVVAFSDSARFLFPKPQQASPATRARARRFINSLDANGGTWMADAVKKVCAMPPDEHRIRIVSFMTDGYVGNDFEIIGLIKKYRGTSRWFPFGTGDSVNRFLIDNVAKFGGGEADYVYLNTSASAVGSKFYSKIASPVLTDVKVDFGGLAVKEVFPKGLNDVWSERPLNITGRYVKAGHGNVTISGFSGGKPYQQTLAVDLPENNSANAVLGSLWARAKVDRLMAEDWLGAQSPQGVNKELKEEIISTALQHHIMTEYTSFVAVDDSRKVGGKLQTVRVPVEVPEGVDAKAAGANPWGGYAQSAAPRRAAHMGGLVPPPPMNSVASDAVATALPPPNLPVPALPAAGGGNKVMKRSSGAMKKPMNESYFLAKDKMSASGVSEDVQKWIAEKTTVNASRKVRIAFTTVADAQAARKAKGLVIDEAASKAEIMVATVTREALEALVNSGKVLSVDFE
jgi:Ca-activated chloride channel family protein